MTYFNVPKDNIKHQITMDDIYKQLTDTLTKAENEPDQEVKKKIFIEGYEPLGRMFIESNQLNLSKT